MLAGFPKPLVLQALDKVPDSVHAPLRGVGCLVTHREVLIEWMLKVETTGFGGNGASLLHNVKEPFTLGATKQEKRLGGSLAEVLDFLLDTVRGVTKSPGRWTQQGSGRAYGSRCVCASIWDSMFVVRCSSSGKGVLVW
jgi:hypothetical protein